MMYALIISTLVLTLAGYGVSVTKAQCPVCEAAKNNLPVQGNIVQGSTDTEVCCSSGGVNYFCQTVDAAKATGGLLNGLVTSLEKLVPNLKNVLCAALKTVKGLLGLDLKTLISCLDGATVTCTPPPVPTTPVTPTSPYCASQCTQGLCCTTNGCTPA